MTVDPADYAPKYAHIAAALAAEISNGYRPGDRLPSESALAARFGVAAPTVRQALAVLRERGIVESRHGVGTFVRPKID